MGEELAIRGGTPAKRTKSHGMFPGASMIGAEEEAAVLAVIRSRNLFRNYGPTEPHARQAATFEQELARVLGSPHVLAVNSGTSALMAGFAALGIGPGDEVIVPAYTWIATANAVVLHGAVPVVAEVDESLNLDPERLEERISPCTRAIAAVHMQGVPTDMDGVREVARRHGLKVLEDTAQALGAEYRGQRLGTLGDVGTFSLQTNKIITAGEGGAVACQTEEGFQRAAAWHDGAAIWARDAGRGMAGENYRMAELTAAVARAQLAKLPRILSRMRTIKVRITAELGELGLPLRRVPGNQGDAGVAFSFFAESPAQARAWSAALTAENVENWVPYAPDVHDEHVYAHWTPILEQALSHPGRHPWVDPKARRVTREDAPRSLDLLGRSIFVPCNPAYSDEEVGEVIHGIQKVVTLLRDPAGVH